MATLDWFREEHGSFRYHVTRDDGTPDESKLPAEEVKEEARKLHKSQRFVIERRLGLEPLAEVLIEPADDLPEAEALEPVQHHTHREFSQPVPGMAELTGVVNGLAQAVNRLNAFVEELAGREYASTGHGHRDLEDAISQDRVSAAHTATEVARIAETVALHLASREIHAVPDLSGFVTIDVAQRLAEQVATLAGHVDEIKARPLVAGHHHTLDSDGRNIEQVLPQLESRVEALESAEKAPVESEVTLPPHVHEFATKGKHKGEWLCACGEAMNTGR